MRRSLANCCAVWALSLALALTFNDFASATTDDSGAATIDYGRRLMTDTVALIGPQSPHRELRYSGNALACSNCHLNAGTQAGALPLTAAARNYPRYFPRAGHSADLTERINGCMVRSLNGRPLPPSSAQMQAMVSYIRSLSPPAAGGASGHASMTALPLLERAAKPARGHEIYQHTCASCHGVQGGGIKTSESTHYLFPPLWGSQSFNDGAGMARLITAARFIHDNMPAHLASPEHPVLSDEDAWDVAAFVLDHPRPHMAGLERDYPTLSEKPIDAPYGAYADEFPPEQHRWGPFAPIEARHHPHDSSSLQTP
jgi:thiosulfate dehydrogenase